MLCLVAIRSLVSDLWNSCIGAVASFDTSSDSIVIRKRPHDCDFLRAPPGVRDVRIPAPPFSEDKAHHGRQHLVSCDDGNTWAATVNDAKPELAITLVKSDK